jgi:hypothetical protein
MILDNNNITINTMMNSSNMLQCWFLISFQCQGIWSFGSMGMRIWQGKPKYSEETCCSWCLYSLGVVFWMMMAAFAYHIQQTWASDDVTRPKFYIWHQLQSTPKMGIFQSPSRTAYSTNKRRHQQQNYIRYAHMTGVL